MEPRIEMLPEKKLVGKRMQMTLGNDMTGQLWKSFMQRRKEITNSVGTNLFSMQVHTAELDFEKFDLNTPFEKWATIEVTDFTIVPDGMESFVLPGGRYAVFEHKGDSSTGPMIFQYIFGKWLPASGYALDNRPHFEILGEKYKNGDPDSEEEIWIPIKSKLSIN